MFPTDSTVTDVALMQWFAKEGSIPAQVAISRKTFFNVLWPIGLAAYQTVLTSGLNFLHRFRRLWKKLLYLGLRCDKYFRKVSTRQLWKPGITNILLSEWTSVSPSSPWWFFVVHTVPHSLFISKNLPLFAASLVTKKFSSTQIGFPFLAYREKELCRTVRL